MDSCHSNDIGMPIDGVIVNDIHRVIVHGPWCSLLCTCLAFSPNLSTLSVSPTHWTVGDTHKSIIIFASPPKNIYICNDAKS